MDKGIIGKQVVTGQSKPSKLRVRIALYPVSRNFNHIPQRTLFALACIALVRLTIYPGMEYSSSAPVVPKHCDHLGPISSTEFQARISFLVTRRFSDCRFRLARILLPRPWFNSMHLHTLLNLEPALSSTEIFQAQIGTSVNALCCS